MWLVSIAVIEFSGAALWSTWPCVCRWEDENDGGNAGIQKQSIKQDMSQGASRETSAAEKGDSDFMQGRMSEDLHRGIVTSPPSFLLTSVSHRLTKCQTACSYSFFMFQSHQGEHRTWSCIFHWFHCLCGASWKQWMEQGLVWKAEAPRWWLARLGRSRLSALDRNVNVWVLTCHGRSA